MALLLIGSNHPIDCLQLDIGIAMTEAKQITAHDAIKLGALLLVYALAPLLVESINYAIQAIIDN